MKPSEAPLSQNQEFLCAFDKGEAEGAFSHRHTLVYGWRLRGEVDPDTLRGALGDVVARHEALRTELVHEGTDGHQVIHPPAPARLEVRDLAGAAARAAAAEDFLNERDAAVHSVRELPHLRAALGRFDARDAVLVLAAHHTATDPWSMGIIARDVAAHYAARRGLAPEPSPPAGQYRDYARWQRTDEAEAIAETARRYWREKLAGARIVGTAKDRAQPPGVANEYAAHRFLVEAKVTEGVLALAKAVHGSAFMVLLAAYNLVLSARTGAGDLVVPTFTSGRYQERFTDVVGPFYNFVPLRTDLSACRTFREVLARTRETCIGAYSHDIPFTQIVSQAPGLVATFADQGLAVIAFELLQSPNAMDEEKVGDLTYTEIRRRVRSQERSSDIPDGVLWATDILPGGEMAASVKFNRHVFGTGTIERLAADFRRTLTLCVTEPDAPIPALFERV